MLKFFRKKHISKIIFWGLVILILPAFVMWGSGSTSRSKDKGPVFAGIIDGKKVSFEQLFGSLTSIRSQIILNYFSQPQVMDALLKNKGFLAKVAWDRLIMLKEVKKRRIKVADNEVISYIRSHPMFSRNGVFDPKIYEYVLRYNIGLSPRNFEEVVRDNMAIQKLKDAVTKGINVSDEEILTAYKRDNERIKISYLLAETKDFLDKVSIDDSRVKDYYEKHKTEFTLPAKEGDAVPGRIANYEDVKKSILSYLGQEEARGLAFKYVKGLHGKIAEMIKRENAPFEEAVKRLGLKTSETDLFSKADYIEGLGEALIIVEAASRLSALDKISFPVAVRSGAIIFRVIGSKGIDEEKFKKEKTDFTRKSLEEKKGKLLDEWFAGLYFKTSLKIDLKDIEKYYR